MWAEVLIAAETWGCPPWEIAEDDENDRLTWFNRWRYFMVQREKKLKS